MNEVMDEDAGWAYRARAAALRVADLDTRSGNNGFTAQDVHGHLAAQGIKCPVDPRAMGAVMRSLSREGLIYRTGALRKSGNKTNHNRELSVWRAGPKLGMVVTGEPAWHDPPRAVVVEADWLIRPAGAGCTCHGACPCHVSLELP